jgi:hypothetical protein
MLLILVSCCETCQFEFAYFRSNDQWTDLLLSASESSMIMTIPQCLQDRRLRVKRLAK